MSETTGERENGPTRVRQATQEGKRAKDGFIAGPYAVAPGLGVVPATTYHPDRDILVDG